jgi:hypothetical protein
MVEKSSQPEESTVQLIDSIHRAFIDIRRYSGISWREADEIDNRASAQEIKLARSLDTDQTWEDVSPSLFDQLPSAVSYLDNMGFRYYLPAFMTADLRRHGQ